MSSSLLDYSPPGSSAREDSPGKNTGVGCHALLQGIFEIQGSDPGLLHCKRILYCLSHQGSPYIMLILCNQEIISAGVCEVFLLEKNSEFLSVKLEYSIIPLPSVM